MMPKQPWLSQDHTGNLLILQNCRNHCEREVVPLHQHEFVSELERAWKYLHFSNCNSQSPESSIPTLEVVVHQGNLRSLLVCGQGCSSAGGRGIGTWFYAIPSSQSFRITEQKLGENGTLGKSRQSPSAEQFKAADVIVECTQHLRNL